jgi:hypothetical protein
MSKVRKVVALGGLDDPGRLPEPSAGDLLKRAADAGTVGQNDDRALLARLAILPAYADKPSLTGTAQPEPAPQEPLKIMIPSYLNRALTAAAGERKVSKRWLVMDALRQAGFEIRENDVFEDGRRFRGSARR